MEVDTMGGPLIEQTTSKRKIYEVDSESMTQVDVETLIRKDIDHICSIFGIAVSIHLLK